MDRSSQNEERDVQPKGGGHIETNRENGETGKKFPAEDAIGGVGALEFPSQRKGNTDDLNPDDYTVLDDDGFADAIKYSAEEAGEAGDFTSADKDAVLEEKITGDQNRQGGEVNLKSTNEPLGRSPKSEEETENL